MSIKNKWVKRIKDGMLKEIFKELLWITGYGIRYKKSILGYILVIVFVLLMGLTVRSNCPMYPRVHTK